MQWYYRAGDKAIGPMSADDLKMLAGQGIVRAQTMVRREGDSQWVAAGHVAGLLDGDENAELPALAAVTASEDSSGARSQNQIPEMQVKTRPPSLPVAGLPGIKKRASRAASGLDSPVVVTAGICGMVLLAVAVAIFRYVYFRDTWSEDMRYEIPRRVDRAVAMSPFESASACERILVEAEGHTITNESVRVALDLARSRLAEIKPAVEAEKQRIRDERQRQLQEAAAKLEQEREETRLAAEKAAKDKAIRDEAKRLRLHYMKPTDPVRQIILTVTRLAARTEAGLTYNDYINLFGETLAEFRVFELTKDAEDYPAVTFFCRSALDSYGKASNEWSRAAETHITLEESDLHEHWLVALVFVEMAKETLDSERSTAVLENYLQNVSKKNSE